MKLRLALVALPLLLLPLVAADAPRAASGDAAWIDKRLPAEERAILAATEGFAPGALPKTVEIQSGDFTSFEALRGKVVIIQSFSSKTEAGRAPLIRLPALLKDVNADDFQLVLLHTPEGADTAATFLTKQPQPAPVIIDTKGAYCDDLGVYKRPVTILLDKNSTIRASGVSIASLAGAVKTLAAEPFDAASTKPETLKSRDERDGTTPATPQKAAPAKRKAKFPTFSEPVGANDLRGKKGPKVNIRNWMANKPETEGKVVMVEFWATWCGPCVANIPHLNELHGKFKDSVAIIGVSDEAAGTIKTFMKKHKFEYAVASDQSRSIINAVKPSGIPHAIIMCPEGIVRWQGHPGGLNDAILQQIVDASDIKPAGEGDTKFRWVTAAKN